jgi:hypothetical protein
VKVNIVFDSNAHNPDLCFVEIEDLDGHSLRVGEWIQQDDESLWYLQLDIVDPREKNSGGNEKEPDLSEFDTVKSYEDNHYSSLLRGPPEKIEEK